MIQKDEGVVLGGARSGETSKVITFFGRRLGKIKLLGKGALGSRSGLRAALQTGNLIEVVYYHKEGRTLYFLKEAHTVLAATPGQDLVSTAAALAPLELIAQVCYWASPEERVVDLFTEYRRCDPVRDPLLLFIGFEFRLLEILGLLPNFFECSECGANLASGFYHPAQGSSTCTAHSHAEPHRVPLPGGVVSLLDTVANQPLASLAGLEVDADTRKNLGKILHWTYTFHVQGYGLPEALKLIPKG
ncbi:MAG: DNA repair protein RecO [Candidatus Krumholzibacteria bacterium]